MRLVLVRHGQSAANIARRIQGQGDDDLTPEGWRQARAVADRLLEFVPVEAIYTSPLRRAHDTALVIGERLDREPVVVEDLREINLGALDGLNSEESRARYPEVLRRWADDDLTLVFPEGEPLLASYQRGLVAIRRLVGAHPSGTIVVVTHAGLLAGYLSYVIDGRFSVKRIYDLRNCSLTELVVDAGGPITLARYNDHTHLAPPVQPADPPPPS